MITTQEEQERVYKAVEAVLKAQTGAYRAMQNGHGQPARDADAEAPADVAGDRTQPGEPE